MGNGSTTKEDDELVVMKIKAERSLDKVVRNNFCKELMEKAKHILNEGPKAPLDLLSVFSLDELSVLTDLLHSSSDRQRTER